MKILLLYFSLLLSSAALEAHPHKSRGEKTICLNMIVKNEKEVIEQCLGSVRRLIDYWVIVDTGSTDGTQQVIKDFLKDIPGELHERPWVDFAHNRNEALALAREKGDYLLFIDADEILEFEDDFALPSLTMDGYVGAVRQVDAVDFRRVELVNSRLPWTWKGVLHETLECPEAKSFGFLKGMINVCTSAKGVSGRSKDPKKYLKDALVFEDALKKEPGNSRYVYYLAQSYLAAEELELALKNYQKRASMESADVQETYMSLYWMGRTEEKLGDFSGALKSYLRAYEYRPTRAEPLLRIAALYRKQKEYFLGYLVSKYALSISFPNEDSCVEYQTYDYALLVEFANCALLLGKFQEGLEACCKLLANPNLPAEIKGSVTANYELAKRKVYAGKSQLGMVK